MHYRFLLFLTLSLYFLPAQAQVGVSGNYLSGQADSWQFTSGTTSTTGQVSQELPGTGWQAGIDYWFRLKNLRIEFLPTLAYSQQEQAIVLNAANLDTKMTGYHFFFNTNFYLFDFKGDCDCPTFSKQGPSLQKGIFLQLSPGYSSFNFTLSDALLENELEASDSQFSVGLALGLDLGVSDLLTITPMVGARYYSAANWETLGDDAIYKFPDTVTPESSLLQYTAGLRIGLRFDQ